MEKSLKMGLKRVVSVLLAVTLTVSLFSVKVPIDIYAEDDPYVELSQTLTAQDTFAWTEYDHDNFRDSYAPSIPDHIIYDGDNIKMIGYGYSAFKDFLLINDTENKNSKKTFSFKIKRDGSDWHSMEGGGFLFNSSVKNNILSGFCVLVTQSGLKLVQITGVDVNNFRNGSYSYVQNAGKLLKTYSLSNLYGEHDFKIEVNNTSVSVWDGANVVIDGYVLPENNYGYGYGPITSHISHGCSQQSYFTFNDISMEEVVIHYVPKKPADLKYTVNDDSSVVLSWTQPDGKAEVAGYDIYRDGVKVGASTETTYTDTVNSGNYSYYVCAVDTEGYISENSEPITVDSMPPEVPSLRVDSVSETSAVLSWDCSDNVGVISYEVYRNNELVKTTSENSYEDSSLEDGTEYVYYVTAYDNSGNKASSDSVIVNTKADMTQPVIVSLSPASGNYSGAITLNVTAKDNRSVKTIVIQTSADKKNWENAAEIETNGGASASVEYILAPANEGVIYVRAYAVNSGGITGEASSAVQYNFDSSAPDVPANVTLSLKNSQIEIRWTAPDNEDTEYFRVYRKASDSDYALIKDNYKYLNYFDTDIDLGTEYTYCVTAVDKNGNESAKSEEVTGGVKEDNVKPEILSVYPENGAVLDTNQLVGISARDNFRLDSITVECRPENGEWTSVFAEDNINIYAKAVQFELDTSSFTTGRYEIRAYAKDKAGNVSEYANNSYTFKECALSAPVLTAEGEGWRNELSWTMENTEDLLGYHIYRKTSKSGNYFCIASIKDNKYTDSDLTPDKTYYYMVEAVDSRNNTVKSGEVMSVPTNNDDIIPLANAGADTMGIAGEAISFNGSNSWDNHYVVSYEWNFGDGTTAEGAKVSHSYEKDGTYDVTLTVKDSAGNFDSHAVKAYIYSSEYGTVQLKTIDEKTKASIGNVKVYCDIEGIDSSEFMTDANGNFKLIAPKGTYDIYFYKNEYLPQHASVKVTGEASSLNVEIEKKNLVDGDLTVRSLDINEMIELGIDVNDPENQVVFEYTVDYGADGKLGFTVNSTGNIIGEVTSNIPNKENNNVFTTVRTITGGNSRPSRPGHGGSYGGGSGQSRGIPVSVAVFNVSTNLSWLKEFYDVDLTIINNADDDFSIQNSTAVLNLPDGLSLADTLREENLTQIMGNNGVIGGKKTEHASWIVRGDKPGSYDLSAEFTGVLMPLNEDVKVIFKTEKPLVVHDGTGLKLDITVTEGLDYWTNSFTFTNNSDRPIYNFAASFSGSAQLAEFSAMYIKYPDGSVEIVEINNGVPDLENSEFYIPITSIDENIYSHRTIKPGESVTGYFSICRRDGFTD